jgi:hypothetical protein
VAYREQQLAAAKAEVHALLLSRGAGEQHLLSRASGAGGGSSGPMRRSRHRCAACGASAGVGRFQVCAGCGEARYCDGACQRAHWPVHRGECQMKQQAA